MAAKKEFVILVDENDRQIGQEEKHEAHRNALLHRAFSVFILREHKGNTEILLQKRQKRKYHSGGLWTNACCGHPRPGENSLEGAQRRLFEELGIHVILKESGVFHYKTQLNKKVTENEIDHIFVGHYQKEEIPFDPNEVEEIRWISTDSLKKELQESPEQFTVWFQEAYRLQCSSNKGV